MRGPPAIRTTRVAASIVVPGLPVQGAARRTPDEPRGFDTQASRHPILSATRDRPVQSETIGSHWPAHYLGLTGFLGVLEMTGEAGADALLTLPTNQGDSPCVI